MDISSAVNHNYFPGIVGLEKTKNKLAFLINSYKNTGYFPNCLFCAGRGHGKTYLISELARYLNKKNSTEIKPFLLINSATLTTFEAFITQIYVPYIQDKEVTIAFDECHELPKKLMVAFLTLFNTSPAKINTYIHEDINITFDFNKQTFFFITTETQKIFHAFQDRLEKIVLESYSIQDLSVVIQEKLKTIKFEDNLLLEIAKTVRGNPRKAVQLAEKIYCFNPKSQSFTHKDWQFLCSTLDILPLGINRIELDIMKVLSKLKTCNLTTIAANTNLTRESLMRDHELYLLKHNLIEIGIGSKRQLTNYGHQLLSSL